jgi:hypothetical protein
MMFRLGVTLVALAVLYGLTAVALWAVGLLGNWNRIAFVLAATFAAGIMLLLD